MNTNPPDRPAGAPAPGTASVTPAAGGEPVAEATRASTRAISQYSQEYSISRNPFGVSAVLPLMLLAFIGLEIALLVHTPIAQTMAGFMVFTAGLLLIPSVALRGSLNFDERGVEFRRGKDFITASWQQVTGLSNTRNHGVLLTASHAEQSRPNFTLAGGFVAREGEVAIPIRLFGDRKFAILYEVRDRVPEGAWLPALEESRPTTTRRALIVYALAVALCVASIIAVAIAVQRS